MAPFTRELRAYGHRVFNYIDYFLVTPSPMVSVPMSSHCADAHQKIDDLVASGHTKKPQKWLLGLLTTGGSPRSPSGYLIVVRFRHTLQSSKGRVMFGENPQVRCHQPSMGEANRRNESAKSLAQYFSAVMQIHILCVATPVSKFPMLDYVLRA